MTRTTGKELLASKHLTMADTATERLHEAIISGDFAPGAPLRLIEISEQLGMSSMPVREAIRRLEAIGLVSVLPHRGAFVRDMSLDDFEDTISTRRLLECECVGRAAAQFRPEDTDEAEQHLDRYLALTDARLLVEARTEHRNFHYAIYSRAGSRWLLHAIDTVWKNSERYRFAAEPASSRSQSLEEHTAILQACARRDPSGARAALAAHLDQAASRMRTNLLMHEGVLKGSVLEEPNGREPRAKGAAPAASGGPRAEKS
jgi:DNA-binding GntR family transcriptional regulator